MLVEVKLPRQSEQNDESLITFWHVSEDDPIKKGDILVEVQTEKAVSEIEAPESGIIKEIKKKRGETVKVDEVLVVIETEIFKQASAVQESAVTVAERIKPENQIHVNVKATPRVKKLARELGVDWQQVIPKGSNGILTEEDIRNFATANTEPGVEDKIVVDEKPIENIAEKKQKNIVAAPSVRKYAREHNINLEEIEPISPNGNIMKSDIVRAIGDQVQRKSPDTDTQTSDRRIPLSGIRKVIASAMVHSKTTIPQVTHFDEVEVSQLVEHRQRLKPYFNDEGVKLTFLAYVVKALTEVLKKYPMLNASLDEQTDEIIMHDHYHIGIAVDTERGLVVPVIKNAEQKSLYNVAKEIEELSQKARNGIIKADEMTGGTCTISNIGSEKGSWFTPIINSPQACIIGIGRIEKKVVVINDNIEIKPLMALSLSYDHRIIDGVIAQKAINEFKDFISKPDLLLAY